MVDPLWQREALGHQRSLRVLGRRLELRSTEAEGLALASARFGRFESLAVGSAAIHMDLVLPPGGWTAEDASAAAAQPADGACLTRHRERESRYVASAGPSLVLADLERREICAFVEPSTPQTLVGEVILASPVWRCLAWEGLVALHAATIRLRGRTLVLIGGSGAGKSTLALAAALAGAQVLCEEVTWLDAAVGEPVLRGEPWHVGIDARRIDRHFERFRLGTMRPDASPEKTVIELASLAPDAGIEVCPIGPIVFLDRQSRDGPADLVPLPVAVARHRFESGLGAGERSQRASRLSAAFDRLAQQGAHRLRFRNPSEALDLLERLT